MNTSITPHNPSIFSVLTRDQAFATCLSRIYTWTEYLNCIWYDPMVYKNSTLMYICAGASRHGLQVSHSHMDREGMSLFLSFFLFFLPFFFALLLLPKRTSWHLCVSLFGRLESERLV